MWVQGLWIKQLGEWMDRWMDGLMVDGLTNGCMYEWMDELMGR
jgi:hypothetical protein